MKRNAFMNMTFAALSKGIGIIGSFTIRTIIIYKLGNEYVGLNSLFTSLLNVLNLAELGFGSAMTFSMYKPVNEGDYAKISALLNFHKLVYRIIGGAVLLIGLLLTPFINNLIEGTYPADINIYILFIIYLLNTVASYTLFTYKSSILVANCRNDILYALQGATQLVMYIIQITVLLLTANYYFYIVFLPLFTIINNVLIYIVTKKRYPEFVDAGKLDTAERQHIFGQIKALLVHRLAGVLITSLDNIVISTILGLNALALFSNYFYIVNAINGLVEIIIASIVSTIGSQLLNKTEEQSYELFYSMSYVSNIMFGTFTICFFNLFQPFVELWVGADNLLPLSTMFLFCIYFYTWRIRSIGLLFRDAGGLWRKDVRKSMVGVVLDLVLDIVLVKLIGINGALISTIFIEIFVFYPWETKVLFKELFHRKPTRYVFLLIQNTAITAVLLLGSWYLFKHVHIQGVLLNLIVRLCFSVGFSAVGFILPTLGTKRFNTAYRLLLGKREEGKDI